MPMMTNHRCRVIWCLIYIVLAVSCQAQTAVGAEPDTDEAFPILPLPRTMDLDPTRVALGKKLFNDPRLSKDNLLACSSCHQLAQGGDDGRKLALTNTGGDDHFNTPTVFNVAFNFRHTRTGKFRTLEEQAEGDMHNPRHGNTTWEEVLPKLQADAEYVRLFRETYGRVIDRESVLDALVSYEKSLITPDARFDRYLRGEQSVLTPMELQGYRLFRSYGCIACHQGINVGGNLFQQLGIFEPYVDNDEHARQGPHRDEQHVFRVPSLRNVAVTAPYFHEGDVTTLEEAVWEMGRLQLGVRMPDDDVRAIVAFLKTLTGNYQGVPLKDGPGAAR